MVHYQKFELALYRYRLHQYHWYNYIYLVTPIFV